jgi:hypothetical protein
VLKPFTTNTSKNTEMYSNVISNMIQTYITNSSPYHVLPQTVYILQWFWFWYIALETGWMECGVVPGNAATRSAPRGCLHPDHPAPSLSDVS